MLGSSGTSRVKIGGLINRHRRCEWEAPFIPSYLWEIANSNWW